MQREALLDDRYDNPLPNIADEPVPIRRYPFGWSASVWSHIALVYVSVSFSGMNVLVQQALPSSDVSKSIGFSFLRDAIATPLLTLAMFLSNTAALPRKEDRLKVFLGMGVIGLASTQLCFITGVSYAGGDNAAVFNCIGPSIMFIMAVPLKLERFTWLKVGGILLGAGGMVLLSELWDLSGSHTNAVFGDAILLTGVVGAQFFTLVQKYLVGYNPLMLTAIAYWAALAFISGVTVITDRVSGNLWPTTWFGWGTALYAGVISSGLNFVLIVFATNHISPLIISLYGLVQSVVTDVFNFMFVGKGLTAGDGIGSVLILASLIVTTYSQAQVETEDAIVAHAQEEAVNGKQRHSPV